MLRALTLTAVLVLSLPPLASAGTMRAAAVADGVRSQEGIKAAKVPAPNGLEFEMKTNHEFIKAAKKLIDENAPDAVVLLKIAETASAEGFRHFLSGEYEFAAEDIAESTKVAIHAIILSRNKDDASIRDFILREEMLLSERRDHERKENMIKKSMAEVEAFMKTGERLLSQNWNSAASLKLTETKELYAASKKKISQGDYDSALIDMNNAYKLATGAVKEIKRSQGDPITFPKAVYTDEKEILAYELKKNNTYVYFASQVVNGDANGAGDLLKAGKTAKAEAEQAIEAGEHAKAVEKLRSSTELFIQAIKVSGVKK